MVELLYEESNFAVVQLPGRAYPGVVIQGDSLYGLWALADEIINTVDPEEVKELADELAGLLKNRLEKYQTVLKKDGIKLPYVPS